MDRFALWIQKCAYYLWSKFKQWSLKVRDLRMYFESLVFRFIGQLLAPINIIGFLHPFRYPWYFILRKLLFQWDIMTSLELRYCLISVFEYFIKQTIRPILIRIFQRICLTPTLIFSMVHLDILLSYLVLLLRGPVLNIDPVGLTLVCLC